MRIRSRVSSPFLLSPTRVASPLCLPSVTGRAALLRRIFIRPPLSACDALAHASVLGRLLDRAAGWRSGTARRNSDRQRRGEERAAMSGLRRSDKNRGRCCRGCSLAVHHSLLSLCPLLLFRCPRQQLDSLLGTFHSPHHHSFAARSLSARCTPSPLFRCCPSHQSVLSLPSCAARLLRLTHSWVAPAAGGCAPAEPSAVCTAPPARADGTG